MITSYPFFGFLYNIQGGQLLLIILVILLLFGGKRLPEIAKGLGKAVNEFRKAANDVAQATKLDTELIETPKPTEQETLAHSVSSTKETASNQV